MQAPPQKEPRVERCMPQTFLSHRLRDSQGAVRYGRNSKIGAPLAIQHQEGRSINELHQEAIKQNTYAGVFV